MKIVIDVKESEQYGLTPYSVYRALYMEYVENQRKMYNKNFYCLAHSCDITARELYASMTGRKFNVKNLILTYADAERCFELFKSFADVWVCKVVNR